MGKFQTQVFLYKAIFCLLHSFSCRAQIIRLTNQTLVEDLVNVTGCALHGQYKLGNFLKQNLSRHEAEAACKANGYSTGIYTETITWKKYNHIQSILEDYDVSGPVTFWDGRFRPYFHVDAWYEKKSGQCRMFDGVDHIGQYHASEMCALVQMDTRDFSNKKLMASDCNEKYPYVCFKINFGINVELYQGFDWQSAPDVLKRNEPVSFNNLTWDCAEFCYNNSACVSYLVDTAYKRCHINTIIGTAGIVKHNLVRKADTLIYGVLTGCNATVISGLQYNAANVNGLPTCDLSPIPPNYCPCGNATNSSYTQKFTESELTAQVNEIINNLTVLKKSTVLYQSRLKSVFEGRPSSVSMGTVAIIILCIVFAIPLLSDITKFYAAYQTRKRNRERNRSFKLRKTNTVSVVEDSPATAKFRFR
ncbi:hypothetical protein DPMN_165253 [Dreissena polymorpha]|uniref:Uncharacterized protein n=1 Tax=Dreissena polymorpha TaxID=45954 RepID=A0A9D4EWJ0_DREPO|nr:hypothetical protein DPMN_165253 [Dreissena polymorpha]